jgi:SPP1 gp7 family putative phage head morphogenesis protein
VQELLERLVFLQHVSNTFVLEVRQQLARLYATIELDLRRFGPTAVEARYRQGRYDAFMARLGARVREFLPRFHRRLKDSLAPLGRQQGVFTRDKLIATLGDPQGVRITPVTEARMRAVLNTEPFQGRVLRDHGKRIGANLVDRVSTQVRMGMVREEEIDDIVRRVRGRRVAGSNAFQGGVLQTTTREAEALVRTAVTHTSNSGMLETLRSNPGVIDGVRYLATLDDRTTRLCLSLDGTEWDLDDPDIIVPGRDTHYNCRSILTPLVAWKRLGMPEPPPIRRAVRDLSTVTDAELDMSVRARRRAGAFGDVEHIPSSVTATEWLRRQRAGVQDKILGRGRADLFRAGDVSLPDLITKDLRTVPLEALR